VALFLSLVRAGEVAAVTLNTGDILVVDIGARKVTRVDQVTGAQTLVSSGGNFFHPSGLAIEASGTLLVADQNALGGGAVFRVEPGIGSRTTVSTGGFFGSPPGLAIEASGTILVADTNAHAVIRVDPVTGAQTVVFSGGSLVQPAGIAIVPAPQVITVAIDIKPGSFPNSINPQSKSKIPVAILSSPTFAAPSDVDDASLTFGRVGNEQSLAFCSPSPQDVNGDGLLDLVCHFNTQQTGFQKGNTVGVLKGKTMDGIPFKGTDSVNIVPSK